MVFQLRPEDTRGYQYPNAQDLDFLGYDRPSDRWKVDASGIHLYASGISVDLDKDNDSVAVWSASGTSDLPVYVINPTVMDKDQSSIAVWSASGTTDVPVYLTSPIEVDVRLDDSIKVYSASGTADLPTYIQNTVRIDGGEDINTTALALESGGNLDIIAMDTTSLDNKIDGSILGGITYDEIDVARDANGNISSFDYQLAAVSQAVITVTRNGAGEITNIVRS